MTTEKKVIAIIGAGAAGLCCARHFLNSNYHVKIFEKGGDVGGTWVYSAAVDGHSSIYKNLRCAKLNTVYINFEGISQSSNSE